jgi:glutathione synthase/RimK-type ligase-like ATP-grasp enzyme
MNLALVTEDRFEDGASPNPYTERVDIEDRYVVAAFEKLGVKTERVSWSRPNFDWSHPRAALLRTPWDYFERLPEFLSWVDHVEAQNTLINPPSLVRWNAEKRYLFDLERRGIAIPRTHHVEKGATTTIAAMLDALDIDEGILKPEVSGGARHTYRVDRKNAVELEPEFQKLLAGEAFVMQPVLDEVLARGEMSLILFDGQLSHAILKTPKASDFRVQEKFGGTLVPYQPSADEKEFALRTVEACSPRPVYARVDMVRDRGRLVLMELEIIEPELFFRVHPPAADVFARVVLGHL